MEEIQITLTTGVIAAPEPQKRTVKALGLKHRHDSRVLKATPAVKGMIGAVRHLVSVGKVQTATPQPFGGVPEYELGAVREKAPVEKKKKEPKPKPVEEVSPHPKKAAKAEGSKKTAKHTAAPTKKKAAAGHHPKASKKAK